MMSIDINCDMGEDMANDAALMPFITSANIACGYHAGNEDIMRKTIELALQNNVAIGAHPGFADKENFGRTEMHLSNSAYHDLISAQLHILRKIAGEFGVPIHHVKPHGALYNMAAKDSALAAIITKAVKDFDENLILYGLSASCLTGEAKAISLRAVNEVFADRTYQDDGTLTPRTHSNALIEDVNIAVQQVLQIVTKHTVTSVNNKAIPIIADTICIHGDGPNAEEFAKAIFQHLKQIHVEIKAI